MGGGTGACIVAPCDRRRLLAGIHHFPVIQGTSPVPLNVAFVMDPYPGVSVDADTSFALMLSASERGHRVFHVAPGTVGYKDRGAIADARPCSPTRGEAAPGVLGALRRGVDVAEAFDVVWIRTDPPFDSDYLHVTQLLALAEAQGTLVINSTMGLQSANEHLWTLRFPEISPASLVTADAERLLDFMADHGGRMVIKPVDGHGGAGVLVVDAQDRNKHALIELLTDGGVMPVLAQEYLTAVREGDKRVLLLDGELLGAVNRVPQDDEHRGNLHVGGTAVASTLTPAEQAACDSMAPALREAGLWFVGIDFIGERLTEINLTSPTGIQEMSRFDRVDHSALVWAWIEDRLDHR